MLKPDASLLLTKVYLGMLYPDVSLLLTEGVSCHAVSCYKLCC